MTGYDVRVAVGWTDQTYFLLYIICPIHSKLPTSNLRLADIAIYLFIPVYNDLRDGTICGDLGQTTS